MNKINEVIFKTVVYADIFDYPLIAEEIKRFLICHPEHFNCHSERSEESQTRSFANAQDDRLIPQNDKNIETDGEYFFLKNRKKIVELRKKREKWSKEKLKIAQKTARWLSFIPWIRMVGVTGSLAMNNSDRNDDIDFLIVAATHRLWLTRFLATILMELLGKRRHPVARHPELVSGSVFKDKICLNMYLDEDHLQVPEKEQDLFTAHEVVQVKLLWDKDQTYQKFLVDNLWVKKYLPNAVSVIPSEVEGPSERSERASLDFSPRDKLGVRNDNLRIFNLLESLAKSFQLWYMHSRRTTEVIADGVIRFHPQDVRKWVLEKYNQKSKQLNIAS